MAYPAPPTIDDFNARFPVFSDYDGTEAQFCLDQAIRTVDNSWRDVDYVPAILYLTAHLLATDAGADGDTVDVGGGTGAIASESFGGMSVSYAGASDVGATVDSSQYSTTIYGRRYYALLQSNRGGPVVI